MSIIKNLNPRKLIGTDLNDTTKFLRVDGSFAVVPSPTATNIGNGLFKQGARQYTVSATNIAVLVGADGVTPFSPDKSYRVRGWVEVTGTDTGAEAIFYSADGVTWVIINTYSRGSNSNHVRFFLNNGIPSLATWHANNYGLNVIVEEIKGHSDGISVGSGPVPWPNITISDIDGNIGIGRPSPTAKLDVNGSSKFNGIMTIGSRQVFAADGKLLDDALSSNVPLKNVVNIFTDYQIVQSQSTTYASFATRVGVEATSRWVVYGDGKTEWGPGGSTPRDTNLYRTAPGILRTDGKLNGALGLQEGGVDLSAKYLGINATAKDSEKLGGQLPSYYLDAANLTGIGTLPEGVLSPNVALRNTTNTFTDINKFSTNVSIGGLTAYANKFLTVGNGGQSPTAGANGMYVDTASGGGIYVGQANNLSQGKFEMYNNAMGIGTMSSHPLQLISANIERIRIATTGEVGIGTTSPSSRLHVKGSGSTSATIALKIDNSSNTELFRINDNGAVVSSDSITATSFIRTGGTSSQFLKADGSIDTNAYSLTSHTHSELVGNITTDLNIIPNTDKNLYYQRYTLNTPNAPVNINNANGVLTMTSHTGAYGKQIAFGDSHEIYIRQFYNVSSGGGFGPWRKLWHDGNSSDFALKSTNNTFLGANSHHHASAGNWALSTKVTTEANERFVLSINGSMNWGPGNTNTDVSLYRSGVGILSSSGKINGIVGLQEGGVDLSAKYLGIGATAADSSKLGGQAPSYYLDAANLTGLVPVGSIPTHVHKGEDITSGTVADIRLSSNVPLKNNGNIFILWQQITRALGTDGWATAVTGEPQARWVVRTDGHQSWGIGSQNRDTFLYRDSAGVLKTDGKFTSAGNNILTGDWDKVHIETSSVLYKSRIGSDLNASGFTTNARWNTTWVEDDSSKVKLAYLQHVTNSRHEFRIANPGTGIVWNTAFAIDATGGIEGGVKLVDKYAAKSHTHSAADLGQHNHAGEDITSGTVADIRLSGNVALKNVTNEFTIFQTVLRSNLTDAGWTTKKTGDTLSRWVVYTDGKQEWGEGTNARDTNLYRSGPGVLQTDGKLNGILGLQEAGVDLVNKYLGINATAKDSEKFGGELPTFYASKTYVDNADSAVISLLRESVPLEGNTLNKLYNRLLAIDAIIGDGVQDGDTIVNTVTELLNVFRNYPEGSDITTILNGKVNYTDIINDLLTLDGTTNKVLDARQGRVLKELLDALSAAKLDKTGVAADASKLGGQLPAYYLSAPNLTGLVPVGSIPTHVHKGEDITSGTVADARLTANVALLDRSNTFTGYNEISRGLITDGALAMRVTGDATQRFLMKPNGNMEWGDGAIARDTILYRSGAGVLKLDGGFIVNRSTGGGIHLIKPGGANYTYLVDMDGKVQWGNGTNTLDSNLYRSGANALKTDGALTAVGAIEGASIKRTGGTSSQFLKADGSIDSTAYQPAGSYQTAGNYALVDHKYHQFNSNEQYYDDYGQSRYLRVFLENATNDLIRFRPVSNAETFNGSVWSPWVGGEDLLKSVLDGRESSGFNITEATRHFRFESDSASGWPTTALFVMQTTWNNINSPTAAITIEKWNGTAWVQKESFNLSAILGTSVHTCSNLHDGFVRTRFTIQFSTITGTGTTIPLRRIMLLTNYNNYRSLQPFSWNYDREVTFEGNVVAPTFKKTGGTSSQFLKADGSVDSTTYQVAGDFVQRTVGNTITGAHTFTNSNLTLSSHMYSSLNDGNGNVYYHYGTSGSVNSFANLRVGSTSSGTWKLMRFGGDGSFTWDNNTVWHGGNTGNVAYKNIDNQFSAIQSIRLDTATPLVLNRTSTSPNVSVQYINNTGHIYGGAVINGTERLFTLGTIQDLSNPVNRFFSVEATNGNTFISGNTTMGVGQGVAASARLHIRGNGTTSSSTALLVQNSAATPLELLKVTNDGTITAIGSIQGTRFISTVATGTEPLTVASTTVVTNLNADMLDGFHSSNFSFAAKSNANHTITIRDSRDITEAASSFTSKGLYLDFKSKSTIGLTASNTYAGVMTISPWGDDSGGGVSQLAFADEENFYYRFGSRASGFGSWRKVWHAGNLTPQSQLSGTGFVKVTGTTVSYDNTAYLPLTGGTVSGQIIHTNHFVHNSNTNTSFFYFTRSGNTSKEYTRVGTDDTYTYFDRKNDEYLGGINFDIENDDSENSNGSRANTASIRMFSSNTDYWMGISRTKNGTYDKFWHEGTLTQASINNWNTAYGWGNHATVGYAMASDHTIPLAPTGLVLTETGNNVEVKFNQSTTSDVDDYEIWRSESVDGVLGYELISLIKTDEILATMSVIDNLYSKKGAIYYKIYAVKRGKRSLPLSGTITTTSNALNVANLAINETLDGFLITYDIADDSKISNIEIKVHTHNNFASLSEGSAVTCYTGINDTYYYRIPESDLDKFHQFWVYTNTKV